MKLVLFIWQLRDISKFSVKRNGKILFVSLAFHMVTRIYTYLNRPAAKAIGSFKYVHLFVVTKYFVVTLNAGFDLTARDSYFTILV